MSFWFRVACLAGIACFAFYNCFGAWRKNRLVGDTPTSRVRSAAQGYVEFTGRGMLLPGTLNAAPLSGISCTWWRYKIEEREGRGRGRSWTTVDSGTSEAPFVLEDGTGRCLVDPRGADVYPSESAVWYGDSPRPAICLPGGVGWLVAAFAGGAYRYTEHRLGDREELYAIGAYHTLGGVSVESPERAVTELLRDWKQNQSALLERFDTDHDGVLCAAEWDLARAAARAQVMTQAQALTLSQAASAVPSWSVLAKPADGRPYLLAAGDESSFVRRLQLRAAASVAAFLCSAAGLTWMFMHLW